MRKFVAPPQKIFRANFVLQTCHPNLLPSDKHFLAYFGCSTVSPALSCAKFGFGPPPASSLGVPSMEKKGKTLKKTRKSSQGKKKKGTLSAGNSLINLVRRRLLN